MPFVVAAPEMMTATAADLATIASNVDAAHLRAAAPTTAVVPAAADEVSAAIASVFANHAQAFQGLAEKAAAFNDQFVQTLKSGAATYAQTDDASIESLSSLLQPAIQMDVAAGFDDLFQAFGAAAMLLVFGIVVGYLALLVLFAAANYILTDPMQAIPALLAAL